MKKTAKCLRKVSLVGWMTFWHGAKESKEIMTPLRIKRPGDDEIERIKRQRRTDEFLLAWALEEGQQDISLEEIRNEFDIFLKLFLREIHARGGGET